MAFWGELKKTAEKTARGVSSKAKEVAEVTRLNGQMAVRKTESEKLYAEIGKEYCAVRTGAGENEKLKELCQKAVELQDELSELQKQLDILHKVRRCPVCGEVTNADAKYCGSCGTQFNVETVFVNKAVIVPETMKIDVHEANEKTEEAEDVQENTESPAQDAPADAIAEEESNREESKDSDL